MSEFQLIAEILRRSVSKNWDEAKLEWYLAEVRLEDEPSTCLCTHFPIKEICVIRNRLNGVRTEVGNVCVKKFLGLPSGKIFDALGRVGNDETKALNAETVAHAFEKGWMTERERSFYLDTWRKRVLSQKQLAWRISINRKVLARARSQSS